MKKTIFLILFITFNLSSCTFPEVKQPQFERDWTMIESDLKSLSDFENVGINFRTFGTGAEAIHSIDVSLINGKNLPEEEDQLKEIGKEALKIVVNSISNEDEYHQLVATFVTENNGIIVKTSKTVPFVFLAEDLDK